MAKYSVWIKISEHTEIGHCGIDEKEVEKLKKRYSKDQIIYIINIDENPFYSHEKLMGPIKNENELLEDEELFTPAKEKRKKRYRRSRTPRRDRGRRR